MSGRLCETFLENETGKYTFITLKSSHRAFFISRGRRLSPPSSSVLMILGVHAFYLLGLLLESTATIFPRLEICVKSGKYNHKAIIDNSSLKRPSLLLLSLFYKCALYSRNYCFTKWFCCFCIGLSLSCICQDA